MALVFAFDVDALDVGDEEKCDDEEDQVSENAIACSVSTDSSQLLSDSTLELRNHCDLRHGSILESNQVWDSGFDLNLSVVEVEAPRQWLVRPMRDPAFELLRLVEFRKKRMGEGWRMSHV